MKWQLQLTEHPTEMSPKLLGRGFGWISSRCGSYYFDDLPPNYHGGVTNVSVFYLCVRLNFLKCINNSSS